MRCTTTGKGHALLPSHQDEDSRTRGTRGRRLRHERDERRGSGIELVEVGRPAEQGIGCLCVEQRGELGRRQVGASQQPIS